MVHFNVHEGMLFSGEINMHCFVVYLQVHYGIQFGPEIDMWSIGCILAEIYLGQPLICGTSKKDILQSVSTAFSLSLSLSQSLSCLSGKS